jgi:hypothetical protein
MYVQVGKLMEWRNDSIYILLSPVKNSNHRA